MRIIHYPNVTNFPIFEHISTKKHFSLSSAHFAQRIHKSPGFISMVETGMNNVSDDTIKSVCPAFSINESWIKTAKGEMTSQAAVDVVNARNHIREIRRDEGLTQNQYAAATGYTNVQIHLVESGKAKESDRLLKRICEVYGVSQEWMMTGLATEKRMKWTKMMIN